MLIPEALAMSSVGLVEMAEWIAQLRGWPALALAYASVQGPMLAGLMHAQASWRRWVLSPLLAAPLTAVTAAGMAAAGPFVQSLSGGGLWSLATGICMSAGAGYAAGLHWARRHGAGADWHHRGTIIEENAMQSRLRIQPEGTGLAAGMQRTLAQDRSSVSGLSGNAGRAAGLRRAGPLERRARPAPVTLAGFPLAAMDETKHFKLIGTTGTGKSTAIRELLQGALARGDRAVIADPDGGYLRHFHDPRRADVVLNPFEPDSVKWDLFGEIQTSYDIDQLARSLIPDHSGADRSWRAYARTFFCAVARQAHAAGVNDVAELYRLLVSADTTELRGLVAGTPAQPFLEEHNGRMFDSIRSVTSSAVDALEHVAEQHAQPFSVRQWVAREGSGVLFIPYRAGQIAALRSAVSAWMRLGIFEAMNQGEGDQRLWFIVDELDAIGQIDGLKDALARLRKFGGRCVLGFQSIAQVSSTYGAGEAQTIVENCGNTLILRCSGSEHGGTSHFASRLIGQREIRRTSVSHTRRSTQWTGSTTRAEHYAIEPAVMDSQIEQLADLEGYLKFASRPQWMRVELPPPYTRCEARATPPDAWTRAWRARAVHPPAPAASPGAGADDRITPRTSGIDASADAHRPDASPGAKHAADGVEHE